MKIKFLVLLSIGISAFIVSMTLYCVNTVTFYIRPYREFDEHDAALIAEEKLKKPNKFAISGSGEALNEPLGAGIFSTYAGFVAVSDYNGQTTFPLLHEKPIIYILVTREVEPVLMAGNTIAHWHIKKNFPAKLYMIEREQDKETEEYFWRVKNQEIPDDKKVSRKAIIIFANPEKILLPEGITPTKMSEQLVLPDVYSKKSSTKVDDALFVLNMKHFFSPVKRQSQYESRIMRILYY